MNRFNLKAKPIAILGGTFDPIHCGHLKIAEFVFRKLKIEEIRFIPCYKPFHRSLPKASGTDRMAMVQLGLKECKIKGFIADDREIKRKGISFMYDTLKSLTKDFKNRPLSLIMGDDVFIDLDKWYNWQKLFSLTHFIIFPRQEISPKNNINESWQNSLVYKETFTEKDLFSLAYGKVYRVNSKEIISSSSKIRNDLKIKGIAKNLPKSVADYISKNSLYQSDIH